MGGAAAALEDDSEELRAFFRKISLPPRCSAHLPCLSLPAYDARADLLASDIFDANDLPLQDNECATLAKAITSLKPTQLRTLLVRRSNMARAFHPLFSALIHLPDIETFDAGENQISSSTMPALDQLHGALSLKVLSLRYNFLRDEGAIRLASVMKGGVLPMIERLHLGDNEIYDDGAGAIFNTGCACPRLKHLSLTDNHLTDASSYNIVQSFESGFRFMSLGEYVHLQGNAFTQDSIQVMQDQISCHANRLQLVFGQFPPRKSANDTSSFAGPAKIPHKRQPYRRPAPPPQHAHPTERPETALEESHDIRISAPNYENFADKLLSM